MSVASYWERWDDAREMARVDKETATAMLLFLMESSLPHELRTRVYILLAHVTPDESKIEEYLDDGEQAWETLRIIMGPVNETVRGLRMELDVLKRWQQGIIYPNYNMEIGGTGRETEGSSQLGMLQQSPGTTRNHLTISSHKQHTSIAKTSRNSTRSLRHDPALQPLGLSQSRRGRPDSCKLHARAAWCYRQDYRGHVTSPFGVQTC